MTVPERRAARSLPDRRSRRARPPRRPPARTEVDPRGIRALIFLRDRGIFVLWVLLLRRLRDLGQPLLRERRQRHPDRQRGGAHGDLRRGRRRGDHLRRARPVHPRHGGDGRLHLRLPDRARPARSGWACSPDCWSGCVVGLANGLISLRGFNPIIVTIGTLSITTAAASIIASGYTIPGLNNLEFMGTRRYGGVPAPVWIAAVVFLLGTIFLTRTRDGLRLMAVGGNAEAVRRSGIHSDRYKVLGFVISSMCAALGGLVSAAVVTEASPEASPAIIFTALTAVALAGVSLVGGRGSLPRVLVGALVLATISNGLTIKGVDPYWGTGVTGFLLLGSLGLEKWVSTHRVQPTRRHRPGVRPHRNEVTAHDDRPPRRSS